jgi:hypothetical protein
LFIGPNGNKELNFKFFQGTGYNLHQNTIQTSSWQFNVLGENEWIFFPPNHTKYFSKKINILDDEKYERFEGISKNGDIIFIPPLWYIFFHFKKGGQKSRICHQSLLV